MKQEYDIVVVGGGPAGTAATITAARAGLSVLLLERGHFPRQKVCGEFVSAESLKLLTELLSQRKLIEENPELSEVKIFIDGRLQQQRVEPAARSVKRWDLDEHLWKSAHQAGSDSMQGVTVRAIEPSEQSFLVKTSAGDFRTRTVINASGRWSELRTAKRLPQKRWLGIKNHFRGESLNRATELHFFRGGYCGIQPIGDGCINVCAMVLPEVGNSLRAVFKHSPALEERSEAWEVIAQETRTSPLFFSRPMPVRDGVLCVGDAAGFIDPFAGDGISLALQSGTLAAQALLPYLLEGKFLTDCTLKYASEYHSRFSHAFSAAARLRQVIEGPWVVRWAGMQVFSFPLISRAVLRVTRALPA